MADQTRQGGSGGGQRLGRQEALRWEMGTREKLKRY